MRRAVVRRAPLVRLAELEDRLRAPVVRARAVVVRRLDELARRAAGLRAVDRRAVVRRAGDFRAVDFRAVERVEPDARRVVVRPVVPPAEADLIAFERLCRAFFRFFSSSLRCGRVAPSTLARAVLKRFSSASSAVCTLFSAVLLERLAAGRRAVVRRAVVRRAVELRAVVLRAGDLRAVALRAAGLRADELRALVLRAVVLRDLLELPVVLRLVDLRAAGDI